MILSVRYSWFTPSAIITYEVALVACDITIVKTIELSSMNDCCISTWLYNTIRVIKKLARVLKIVKYGIYYWFLPDSTITVLDITILDTQVTVLASAYRHS